MKIDADWIRKYIDEATTKSGRVAPAIETADGAGNLSDKALETAAEFLE